MKQFRLVLDTNSLLSGLANPDSASGRVLDHCENRRVLLLLSRPVQAEYRRVLGSAEMLRLNPQIDNEAIELVLRRLRYVGEYLGRIKSSFRFDRDPDDEPLIELAIAGKASHLVTSDNDLLSLTAGHDDASRRFRQRLPGARVLRPATFLGELELAGVISSRPRPQ
jgi:putative PIN family toxin of toxin-antitoxin system